MLQSAAAQELCKLRFARLPSIFHVVLTILRLPNPLSFQFSHKTWRCSVGNLCGVPRADKFDWGGKSITDMKT